MLRQITIFMTLLFYIGCAENNPSTVANNTPTVSGQFIDEPVEGLSFECSSGLSGVTDFNGTFTCHEDDTITFKIGSIVLGSSIIKNVITPLHLYQDASNTEQAYNVAQLLHSLDSDTNPDNGILLNTEISLEGISIDMDIITFEDALTSFLASVGMILYNRDQSIVKMLNYIAIHDDGRNYDLDINIEDALKAIESQICSSSQKLKNAECIAKTCETDGYGCPTCTVDENLVYTVDGNGECVIKICEIDGYNCPIIPTCTASQKLVDNICIAKTCEADSYECPVDANASLEPFYYQQWYLEKNETFYNQNNINSEAHIHSNDLLTQFSGNGIKIAIIDDGLDVSHEDLSDAIIATYDIGTKTSNVTHTNQNGYHGTAVTGIVGARVNSKGITGVASKSQIIFLKHKEGMSDSETIELFNKAEEFDADIINCSWGTYDVSQSVKEKIQDLAVNGRDGKGTIIVFAVGNDDQDMGNDESAIPEVIAVGSTDKDNLRTWYSNYGDNIDIMAPGGYDIGITTLDSMNSNGLASIDENYLLYNDSNSFIGTSASAPIVSGAIALLLEKNPNLTRIEIESILRTSSEKIGNVPYIDGRNNYYGYGKLNLFNCINSEVFPKVETTQWFKEQELLVTKSINLKGDFN